MERYRYIHQTTNPETWVAEQKQAGRTAYAILTGSMTQDTHIILERLQLGLASIEDVKATIGFREDVARIIVPELSEIERADFVQSLIWTGGTMDEVIAQNDQIRERHNNGEFTDLEKVFELFRQKLRHRIEKMGLGIPITF